MAEKFLFCFAFALQIFAWFLAGAKIGFRADRGTAAGKRRKAWYNTLALRRAYLAVGAGIVLVYAYFAHDYVLLAGQAVLFLILWFRVALERK